jgi:hypothetical protein
LVALYVFRVAIVSPSDPVYVAAKKMRELRVNSVASTMGNKIQGILTYYSFLNRLYLLQWLFSNILGPEMSVGLSENRTYKFIY